MDMSTGLWIVYFSQLFFRDVILQQSTYKDEIVKVSYFLNILPLKTMRKNMHKTVVPLCYKYLSTPG